MTGEKNEKLKSLLLSFKKAAVAYSGGVDSTYLLAAAVETLGKDNVLALTARAPMFLRNDTKETEEFCRERGIKQIIFDHDALDTEAFQKNPPDRCYFCKKALFQTMLSLSKKEGFEMLLDGSNSDDDSDYRPGARALKELSIRSPLKEAGLSKSEIRSLSESAGLKTFDKPSAACLASRIAYGDKITEDKLSMIEQAEGFISEKGFLNVRVRLHGEGRNSIARLEILPFDFDKMLDEKMRGEISSKLKNIGFSYVALDMEGYRMGSMNEAIL